MLARLSWQTWTVIDRRERLSRARLYLVCDARPAAWLHAALRGGVDIVQLRDKRAADDQLILLGRSFAQMCAEHDALFILNDRPDLVAETGADGVHLGQDDTPVAAARSIVGAERLVGLSTHSPAQVDAASRAGVDYIGVGPVYETPTKPGRAAVGLELVRHAASRATVPFFAIGGLDADNLPTVRAAGARGVAVVRALTQAADPERAARELRAELGGAATDDATRAGRMRAGGLDAGGVGVGAP
jgi:thiamine-phosphate pyrophosphorylase